jgi:hypothetical protein
MAAKAAERRQTAEAREPGIPSVLAGTLPPGEPDIAREWCTSCGLPDAPVTSKFEPDTPCPRCGSTWRWYGRLSDRDGAAAGPPDDGTCLTCYEWRRYPSGQEHFGWAWWRTCAHGCACAHHADEVWLA